MWTTPDDVSAPVVRYGLSASKLSSTASASSSFYVWLDLYVSGQIQTATMTGLLPSRTYFYQVGDQATGTWSTIRQFSTDRSFPIRILVTGDVGSTDVSWKTISDMIAMDQQNPFDFVIHSGDLSYANGLQPYWDVWQRKLEPLADHLPYMVTVGNHETASLWLAFLERFEMPAAESGATLGSLYYSYEFGPIHVIGLSSEMFFFGNWTSQTEWLQKDLATIDRTRTPWVFSSWHRPWYCSNYAHQDSAADMRAAYEDLLHQYGVDISFVGHVHACERTLPMYKGQIDPAGLVTIVQGNGGNHEGLSTKWEAPQPEWSAFRASVYGFGVATIYNATTLQYQVSTPLSLA